MGYRTQESQYRGDVKGVLCVVTKEDLRMCTPGKPSADLSRSEGSRENSLGNLIDRLSNASELLERLFKQLVKSSGLN